MEVCWAQGIPVVPCPRSVHCEVTFVGPCASLARETPPAVPWLQLLHRTWCWAAGTPQAQAGEPHTLIPLVQSSLSSLEGQFQRKVL